MSENRFAKYRTEQPEAVPAPAAAPANRFAKYLEASPAPAPPPERMPLEGQFLGKFTEGIAGLPGLPLDAGAAIGNFAKRQFDMPEVPLSETGAKDWGSEGWSNWVFDKLGGTKVDAPATGAERVAQKAGLFFGGSVPFGPGGLVPTATSLAGSEIGRVADQLVPEYTKGYGEAGGAIAGGFAGSVRRQPVRTPTPTVDQLRAQARAAYDAADNAGVAYTPQGVTRLGVDVVNDLANDAYLPSMQPKIKSVLDHLDEISKGNVTLKGIDTLRKAAGNAARSGDATERMMASKIIQRIDDFVDAPQQGEVLMGNAQAGAAALKDARALYHRMSKADKIEAALENADIQAGSTYSGGNIDNATRQKLRPMIMRGNKQNRGWTADEKAMLRTVVKGGGLPQKLLRTAGKLSPEGSGLMAQLHLMAGGGGAMLGAGPLGFAPAAVGFASKRVADAMTRGNVKQLLDTVRRGGTAYQPRTPGGMLTRSSAPMAGITADQERKIKRMLTKQSNKGAQ